MGRCCSSLQKPKKEATPLHGAFWGNSFNQLQQDRDDTFMSVSQRAGWRRLCSVCTRCCAKHLNISLRIPIRGTVVIVGWMRNVPIGSYIWTFGPNQVHDAVWEGYRTVRRQSLSRGRMPLGMDFEGVSPLSVPSASPLTPSLFPQCNGILQLLATRPSLCSAVSPLPWRTLSLWNYKPEQTLPFLSHFLSGYFVVKAAGKKSQ